MTEQMDGVAPHEFVRGMIDGLLSQETIRTSEDEINAARAVVSLARRGRTGGGVYRGDPSYQWRRAVLRAAEDELARLLARERGAN